MNFDYVSLNSLKENNITFSILNATHFPLFMNFIYEAFISQNRVKVKESDLLPILDNILYYIKDNDLNYNKFNLKDSKSYLDDWSSSKKGWLSKTWPQNSEIFEPFYDIPPYTQKAYDFVKSLEIKKFVGTESRLRTAFNLLNEMYLGISEDKDTILSSLIKKRDELTLKIKRIENGEESGALDDFSLRERFYDFQEMCLQIYSDFREVEYNFKNLNRDIRKEISVWDGSKGELLERIFNSSLAIENSDQGRSVSAFSSFLLSDTTKTEFKFLLEKILKNEVIAEEKDEHIEDIFNNWVTGNGQIQDMMHDLTSSLRSFIEDKVYIEHKDIYKRILNIEKQIQMANEDDIDLSSFTFEIELPKPIINMPFERPLYEERAEIVFDDNLIEASTENIENTSDVISLFNQIRIDKDEIISNINLLVQKYGRITLKEILDIYPLTHGLTELVVYLQICNDNFKCEIDESVEDELTIISEDDGFTNKRQSKGARLYISFKEQ